MLLQFKSESIIIIKVLLHLQLLFLVLWKPEGDAHLCVTGTCAKAAACAAARATSRMTLVALPPFILDEPLTASG